MEYKDCFAQEYYEMPSLDRSIIEHWLPIKQGFWPYKQHPRLYKPEVLPDIKDEITHLSEINFIQQCRYAEWVSNIDLVYKKNGKLHVCIDFRT
jgi:hypothetical protein